MTKASNPRAVIGDNSGIDPKGANRLRTTVERVERIEEEIAALNADKRDVYAEAKGSGLDVPTVKKVVARRRKDPEALKETDELLDVYEGALSDVPAPGAVKASAKKGGKK